MTQLRTGSTTLDAPPPGPQDKIYPSISRPGDDTASLLGPGVDGEEGSEMTPGKKLIMSAAMFQAAANLAMSVSPGSVPPPVLQWIDQYRKAAPQAAQAIARQGDPASMLSAVGSQSGQPGPPGQPGAGPPMGMAAMGIPGGRPG